VIGSDAANGKAPVRENWKWWSIYHAPYFFRNFIY